jgi:hypothetical protein
VCSQTCCLTVIALIANQVIDKHRSALLFGLFRPAPVPDRQVIKFGYFTPNEVFLKIKGSVAFIG